MPMRGSASISSQPAALASSRALAISLTPNATWCRPGPRLARNLPTGDSCRVALQLDLAFAGAEERSLEALFVVDLAMDKLRAEHADVKVDRRIEIGHGDPNVVDAGQHEPILALRAQYLLATELRTGASPRSGSGYLAAGRRSSSCRAGASSPPLFPPRRSRQADRAARSSSCSSSSRSRRRSGW